MSFAEIIALGTGALIIVPRTGDEFEKFRKKTLRMKKQGYLVLLGEGPCQFVYKTTNAGRSALLHHNLKRALKESMHG